MKSKYYGIAFYEPKWEVNIGTALRSAFVFGASFVATIGKRYKRQPTDTNNVGEQIPLYNYKDMEDFLSHVPQDCELVSVEVDGDRELSKFVHPQRAIYLFGGEDRTLPRIGGHRIKINTKYCLNVATTVSIVCYDRQVKEERR